MKKLFIATVSVAALGFALPAVSADGKDHTESMRGMMHGKSEGGHAEHDEAVGKPGAPSKTSRTIEVIMSDNMRFTPSRISVKQGETVKFSVKNAGRIRHEMLIGSMKELREHAEMMRKFPEMKHTNSNQVSVDPGKSGDLIWQFTKAGTLDFACLQPGHLEAGMVGKLMVTK